MKPVIDESMVEFRDNGDGSHDLDVRELLLAGGEPLPSIMKCVDPLGPGETLRVHALFEPAPLIRKLGRQGFKLQCDHAGPDHWVLTVRR